ncbi:MAG: hypothetical protein ACKVX7_18555 [Planctomycetota bacterium]
MARERKHDALFFLLVSLASSVVGCARAPVRDYGTGAELILEKAKTQPADVLAAFGRPDNISGNSNDRETWTYRRMTYTPSGVEPAVDPPPELDAPSTAKLRLLSWRRAKPALGAERGLTLSITWRQGKLDEYQYSTISY